jgi:hypothetical protein
VSEPDSQDLGCLAVALAIALPFFGADFCARKAELPPERREIVAKTYRASGYKTYAAWIIVVRDGADTREFHVDSKLWEQAKPGGTALLSGAEPGLITGIMYGWRIESVAEPSEEK